MANARKCARCGNKLTAKRGNKRFCYPCERLNKREAGDRAHDTYVVKTYGLQPGDYKRLLKAQNGVCPICQRANGRTKRLATDHDHACCPKLPACGKCVRGLLCSRCNQMLGHGRDDPEFFFRAIQYLTDPPANKALKRNWLLDLIA